MSFVVRKRAVLDVLALAVLALIALEIRPSDAPPLLAADGRWGGLHKKAVALRVLNLNETKASVAFFYHAPAGVKTPPELEGRVVKQDKNVVTVGVTLWKQDVAFHAYDRKAKALEVYLLPEHLKDPEEVRIQILPLTKFDAPADVKTVRVVYLP